MLFMEVTILMITIMYANYDASHNFAFVVLYDTSFGGYVSIQLP